MNSIQERLHGIEPFYFVRKPECKVHILQRCKFCGAVAHLGICTRCGSATVCSGCGRVRVDQNHWAQMIVPTSPNISHGICRECMATLYPKVAARLLDKPHAFEVYEYTIYQIALGRTKREMEEEWKKEKKAMNQKAYSSEYALN